MAPRSPLLTLKAGWALQSSQEVGHQSASVRRVRALLRGHKEPGRTPWEVHGWVTSSVECRNSADEGRSPHRSRSHLRTVLRTTPRLQHTYPMTTDLVAL
eukprot:46522-Eustigmatos_ZCMA.PRE.1